MGKKTGSRKKKGGAGGPLDAEKVSTALRALAAEYVDTLRSETARLREVLDDVEAALAAGASHATVLQTLHTHGFTLTASSFERTLARLREEREAGQMEPFEEAFGATAKTPKSRPSRRAELEAQAQGSSTPDV